MSFTLTQANVLLQDNHLLAVNKPANLLSVPGLSEPDNLSDAVIKVFPNARVVHRLDMPTSGIILFALNIEAQRALGKQFEQRKVHKTYQAVLDGELTHHYGCVCAPLICDWEHRPRQKVDWLNGKAAITHYKKLRFDSDKQQTRVMLYPYTGRSHQLRVHMHHLGLPIVGDAIYAHGSEFKKNDFSFKRVDALRLHLHAQKIQLIHPVSMKPLTIDSDVPF